jgi:hypothetical protein
LTAGLPSGLSLLHTREVTVCTDFSPTRPIDD